ncbi:LysE family translocator [Pseudoduganella sp. R-32]|uniref:LysE family translocator n=1 Tax=Pseudoduganella sp. R-32 TaxID=3404061 RepID=UPI003CFB5BEC
MTTMTFSLWLAFLAMALAATFSPGPAVLLAVSTTLTLGARRTAYSSAGNAVGVFLVACVAVGGMGVLFKAWPAAFSALKLGGAAYLAWLGVKQWRNAGQVGAAALASAPEGSSRGAVFRRGMLVACSNPKAILFFAAVFPQFMPPGEIELARFLLLSLTFVACTLVAHLSYVLLAATAGSRIMSGPRMAILQRGTAVLFISLAILLAFE